MNPLDWVLLALVLAYAVSGYWQGFITGAFATIGLLVGGGLGIWAAPRILGDAEPSLTVSIGALFIVIVAASLGQALLQWLGAKVRARITWQPARALDAIGGSVLSAVAVLLVAWALGVAVSGARMSAVTPLVRGSTVLATVDGYLPDGSTRLLRAFDALVGTGDFPRYLEPFAPERIVEVAPPSRRIISDPDVVRAEPAVAKIRGTNSCGRGLEGTGFLYAPGRILTNAHVVAGVDRPEVQLAGTSTTATVVLYDAKLDVAVLAVDSGGVTPLKFAGEVAPREPAAIVGYPQDGPFAVVPARVRSIQRLRSPDIYGADQVLREVLALRGVVQPGNSGGPVLTSAGEVAGMVFAASVTDSETGYAITAGQLADSVETGIANQSAVSTGRCVG